MLEIDGNKFEGGGQILRTALALSVVTGKAFHMFNIRKGREQAGMKAQHLQCVLALQQICDAKVENAVLGSTDLFFYPGKLSGRTISLDIGTAGSITLLLQSLIIPSLFSKSDTRIKIIGGTDVKWASSFDYFTNVFLPHIERYALGFKVKLEKRGYYPEGGGKVEILVKSRNKEKNLGFASFCEFIQKEITRLELNDYGVLMQIKGVSHASKNLAGAEVAERQARQAKLILNSLSVPVNISTEYKDSKSTGSGITVWARFSLDGKEIDSINKVIIGADSLGEKGKSSEKVGSEAANFLIETINSKLPVDKYLSDQLIPFIAIFGGQIKAPITEHCLANAYVCEMFLGNTLEIDTINNIIKSKFWKAF